MARYIVAQGDCIHSIAAHWGITDEELLARGRNTRFRDNGRIPTQLHPGDEVDVPDEPPSRTSSFTGGAGPQTFNVHVALTTFRLRLRDAGGEPVAGRDYQLVVGHRTLRGTTSGDGAIEETIPAAAREGILTILMHDADEQPWVVRLRFGAIDPITSETGVIERLYNLGYGTARAGAEGLHYALRQFQRAQQLNATGEIDAATRTRLGRLYADESC